MYKILLISISFLSLFSVSYAQELPEYCSGNDSNITCEILILPYPSYAQDFDPGIAQVPSGATIIFKNAGFNVHTATSTDANPELNSYYAVKGINGIFDTGKLVAGQTAKSFTIQNPGEYHYLCTIHDAMRGTIIVTGDGIPNWIKNVALFWVEESIDDANFVQVIEYLVNQQIISIPNAKAPQGNTILEIPSWIKTSTEFWVQGSISDDEFTMSLEWMINNGIIRL